MSDASLMIRHCLKPSKYACFRALVTLVTLLFIYCVWKKEIKKKPFSQGIGVCREIRHLRHYRHWNRLENPAANYRHFLGDTLPCPTPQRIFNPVCHTFKAPCYIGMNQ